MGYSLLMQQCTAPRSQQQSAWQALTQTLCHLLIPASTVLMHNPIAPPAVAAVLLLGQGVMQRLADPSSRQGGHAQAVLSFQGGREAAAVTAIMASAGAAVGAAAAAA